MRRWVEPAWVAAYAGICVAYGFQYAFGAFMEFGASLTWVEAALELASIAAIRGMPAFLMVVSAHHAARHAPMSLQVASLGLAVVAGAAIYAASGALVPWDDLIVGGGFELPPAVIRAGEFVTASTLGGALATLLEYSRRAEALEASEREAELAPVRREAADAQARLRQLRSQIEPHFLFNTLANVKRLGDGDALAAKAMLERLADYIEGALAAERMGRHLVSDEVAMARAYLGILAMRMGDRLRVEVDVPRDLEGALLPPLLLGTLIENAVKHGLSPRATGGTVRVRFRKEAGRLEATVSDDGVGFREHSGSGIGLANTKARLKALYGDAASLVLRANPGGGVVAELRLPLEVAG